MKVQVEKYISLHYSLFLLKAERLRATASRYESSSLSDRLSKRSGQGSDSDLSRYSSEKTDKDYKKVNYNYWYTNLTLQNWTPYQCGLMCAAIQRKIQLYPMSIVVIESFNLWMPISFFRWRSSIIIFLRY